MRAIVDTNVILTANRKHQDVSEDCIEACVNALSQIRETGSVVIDDQYLVLGEYRNKLTANHQKGVGDVFLKWVFQNQANASRVHMVPVNQIDDDWFEEFPDNQLQKAFDPPDRKFIAVAGAAGGNAPILQAADCKWLDWWKNLARHGIEVRFLCPDDVCRFYQRKFPDSQNPELPRQ